MADRERPQTGQIGAAMSAQHGRTGAARDAWVVDGFAPLPGDTLARPDGGLGAVETVYLCSEPSVDAVTRWSWIVLADGRLLEVAPRGCALYDSPRVLKRGTGRFLELTAQDGALVRFEERVRSMLDEERVRRMRVVTRASMLIAVGAVVLLGVSAIAQRLAFVRPLASLGIAIALILLAVRALATRAKIRRELVELQLLLEPFVQREQ